MTAPLAPDLVLTLTRADLAALVRAAVADALADFEPAAPRLLDQNALAQALGVSVGTLRGLRREGLPTILVGESPRFELAEVLAWCRARSLAEGQR